MVFSTTSASGSSRQPVQLDVMPNRLIESKGALSRAVDVRISAILMPHLFFSRCLGSNRSITGGISMTSRCVQKPLDPSGLPSAHYVL